MSERNGAVGCSRPCPLRPVRRAWRGWSTSGPDVCHVPTHWQVGPTDLRGADHHGGGKHAPLPIPAVHCVPIQEGGVPCDPRDETVEDRSAHEPVQDRGTPSAFGARR